MDDSDLPVTAAATFTATLVDEWVRAGVTDAVVAPGSRSTPLAVALAGDDRLRVHVHHDERSAGFTALGLATATGRPCVVVTTSGTAAAELHPAAVEADQGRVPLLLCTADRPAELQDVGAPQTITQAHLFGSTVRWFSDLAAPDESSLVAARSLASRSVCEALGPPAGPVHLNMAFRDPLVGRAAATPAGRSGGEPWHQRVVAPRRIAHEDALESRGGVSWPSRCHRRGHGHPSSRARLAAGAHARLAGTRRPAQRMSCPGPRRGGAFRRGGAIGRRRTS